MLGKAPPLHPRDDDTLEGLKIARGIKSEFKLGGGPSVKEGSAKGQGRRKERKKGRKREERKKEKKGKKEREREEKKEKKRMKEKESKENK